MTEYAHENTEAIDKFIEIVNNIWGYYVVPDIGLSKCKFCGIHDISGLSYIDDFDESCNKNTELEIRKKNDDEYDYSYFVCLNCAIFYSNKQDKLKELLDVINNNYTRVEER